MNPRTITPDMTVASVAESCPGARAVLAREGIDLCCGGQRSLEFVARAHGLDLRVLLAELEASVKSAGERVG
jgi:iron-sulfur cluster repair protein YtfE (RIC family)